MSVRATHSRHSAASDAGRVLVVLAATALFSMDVVSDTLVQAALLAGAFASPALLLFGRGRHSARALHFARGPLIWLSLLVAYIGVSTIARSDALGWTRVMQCLICMISYAAGVGVAAFPVVPGTTLKVSHRLVFGGFRYFAVLVLALIVFFSEPEGKNKYAYALFFSSLAIDYLAYARDVRSSSVTIASTIAMSVLLAILGDTRALLIYGGLVLALWGLYALPLVGRRVLRHLLVVSVVLIGIYAQNYEVVAGWVDDAFTRADLAHAGRTALSGRQIIWPEFVRAVVESPIWGVGPSNLPEVYIRDVRLSGHNFYLHFTAEFGFVGLSLAVLALASAWKSVWRHAPDRIASLTPIFLIVAANANEVLLLENVLLVGMLQWFVIGLTVGALFGHERRR